VITVFTKNLVGNAHPTSLMTAGTEARPTFKIKAVGRPSLAARQMHLQGKVWAPTGVKYYRVPLFVYPET